MKLSTLLLTSTALVVAGAAYAADLPAKKAAPAAAPTGCPAFGAGYFQIPGGDTCIKFSGYGAYEGAYTSASAYSQSGDARVIVDTASNTDLGALKSRIRFNGSTSGGSAAATSSSMGVSRAYASLGGFQFGKDDSHADISGVGAGGTYAWNGGTGLGGGTGTGMWYAMNAGAATIELGEETAINDSGTTYLNGTTNSTGGLVTTYNPSFSNRPDLMLKATMPAGPATFTVMGISHSAVDYKGGNLSGYAFLANVSFKTASFGAAVFGGTSNGALGYTSKLQSTGAIPSGYLDAYNGQLSKGANFGVELSAPVAGGTVAVFAGQSSATDAATTNQTTTNYADVEADIPVAKSLFVTPEVLYSSNTSSATTYYLTIHRDF
jgi:Porin subfamily